MSVYIQTHTPQFLYVERQDPKMANKELVKAAQTGNIEVLHKMLQENPLLLAEATISSPEPILLVATKARKLNFVRELIKHDPDAPRELSNDGFRAMDVASGIGDVEIVKELLKVTFSFFLLLRSSLFRRSEIQISRD